MKTTNSFTMNTVKRLAANFFITSERKYDSILDSKLLFTTIILTAFGLIMVYSASIAYAAGVHHTNSQYHYLLRDSLYIVGSLVASVLVFRVNSNFWQKHALSVVAIIVLLLLAVLVPHIGKVVNGARRWLGVGMLSLQPSELAKLATVIYLAAFTTKYPIDGFNNFKRLGIALAVVVGIIALLLLEPDMGSASVIFVVALAMLYLTNLDYRFIAFMAAIGVIGFVVLVIAEPYRMRRILGFVNPWQDALGKGYQLTHSLLAVGHGGWFGVGLGNSIEKLYYLPEAHTDFILAIIAEEFGAFGVLVVVGLFWLIFYRGFYVIAKECTKLPNRRFQQLLAQGVSLWFFMQALINVGVTLGMFPTKGLTLPFISYGGSSILVSLLGIAILLRIDYENKTQRQSRLRY